MKANSWTKQRGVRRMRRYRLSTLLLLALFAAALFLPPSGASADLPADWEPLLQEAPQALKFPVYLGEGKIVYTMGSATASDVYLLDTESGESTQLAAGNGYMNIDKIFVASSGEFYYIASDGTKLCHYAGSQITDITPAALGYNDYSISSVDGSGADNIYLVLNQPSVLLHYDGHAWSSVDVSGIDGYEPAAGDVLLTVCLSGEDSLYMLWRDRNNNNTKKVSYYNGSAWSAVAGYVSDINFYHSLCMGKYLPGGEMLALCRDDKIRVYKDGAEVGAIDIAGLKSSSIIGDETWIAAGSSYSYLMNKGVFRYNGGAIETVALPMTNERLNGITVDEKDNLYLSSSSSSAKGYLFRQGLSAPPAFSEGYPRADNIGTSGFDLKVKLVEPGATCYKVVASGAEPGAAYETWTVVTIPGSDEVNTAVSGLTPGTDYDVYVIAKDEAGNIQNAPVKLEVRTQASAEPGEVARTAGNNRYDTSAKTALQAYPNGAETVIIARGDDEGGFADALAASYLAGMEQAPILLVSPGSLPQEIEAAIEQLGAKKAYVLGGELAVSKTVENKLKALGLQVERITGNNRYATAAAIAVKGGPAETAIVVSGFAPADSLVAGSLAFNNRYPILLVDKNSVPAETKKAIKDLGIKNIIVIGGENAVSKAVYNELKAQERYAGQSRIETSLDVAEKSFKDTKDFSIVGYLKLADAVGAAVSGNPIIYVKNDISEVKDYLTEATTASTNFTIFGGLLAVGDTVENELKGLLRFPD